MLTSCNPMIASRSHSTVNFSFTLCKRVSLNKFSFLHDVKYAWSAKCYESTLYVTKRTFASASLSFVVSSRVFVSFEAADALARLV